MRRLILRTLAELPAAPTPTEPYARARGLTASELARRMQLHVSTVRDHVLALETDGLVEHRDERGHVGRPRRHYAVDHAGLADAASPDAFLMLAEPLGAVLSGSEPDAERAGRRWASEHAIEFVPPGVPPASPTGPATSRGAFLAKVGALADTLERWGYLPEVSTSNAGHTADICLARCPLRDLVDKDPDAACGLHAGVLAGALAALGEPDADLQLLPFARPGICIARITTRATFPRPGESRTGSDRKACHD